MWTTIKQEVEMTSIEQLENDYVPRAIEFDLGL